MLLLAGLAYSLLVTYARAGYGAFLGSMLLMALLHAVASWKRRNAGISWGAIAILLIGGGVFVLVLVQSSYVAQRMTTVSKDMETRMAHWQETIAMMDPDLSTTLFGMGLGQYPLVYAFRNPAGVTLSAYRFGGSLNDPHLELGAGDTLYYEQIIKLKPKTTYTLTMDVMANVSEGSISAPICEKAMLYSFACRWITLNYDSQIEGWQTLTYTFDSAEMGGGGLPNARPVKLSLFNPTSRSIVAIDNVSVVDQQGNEIIKNGDFGKTNDYWFFSTDNHLPWHIKQLGVQLFFSQGLFGLVVFAMFLVMTLDRLIRAALCGNELSNALASGIVGFLIVGLFSSPFDAPRLTFLFFSLVFVGNHVNGGAGSTKSIRLRRS